MQGDRVDSPVIKRSRYMDRSRHSNDLRWNDLRRLLFNPSPFGNETSPVALGEFQPGEETFSFINEECKVLVIGAGGLGCEILKNLALSGFTKIEVIDMDRIDLTNLNRQFLFREADIGSPKAKVAADFINSRLSGVQVTSHFGKIQDFDPEFYRQFNIVVSGLDNIDARRWLNSMLVHLVDVDDDGNPDPETIIPLIDGGTEGFRGQARVIIPRITSCFECSLDAFPPQKVYPMCTIAETPRLPEHCIAYSYIVEWPREFPNQTLDTDSPQDMKWIYEHALRRAEQFGISGVTYTHTLGVVKNIIPAVASTNAMISAMCVNEVLKLMSYCSQTMNNYHMHMGVTGVYSHTFVYEKRENCPVCSAQEYTYQVDCEMTLKQLIHQLCNDPQLRLGHPSITKPGFNLFMQGPPALKQATAKNLDHKLKDLIQDGDVLSITDPVIAGDAALALTVQFQNSSTNFLL